MCYTKYKKVSGVETDFVWDGDEIGAEYDENGNVTNVLFRGNNLVRDSKGNNYVYDSHGSVTSILNNNGSKSKEYEYDAFGNIEKETNASTYNPWQYCGEYTDQESGFIYLRNRYYDSEIGRFINEDPARSGGNWYSYCSGNPIMFWDPSGNRRAAYTDKNGTYHADPDAEEFGKDSDTYKIILDLEKRYNKSDNKDQKDYYARLANDARNLARAGTPLKYGEEEIWSILHDNAEEGKEYIDNYLNLDEEYRPQDPYLWYVLMTCTDWNYKNEAEWKCKYRYFRGKKIDPNKNEDNTTPWIYFDGELISSDKLGNINLGYVGTKMGYSGILVQNRFTEDKDDGPYVRKGINLAKWGY